MKLLALGLLALSVGASQAVSPKPNDPFKEGVLMLRVLNTVEAEMNHTGGTFVPLSAVLETPVLRRSFSEASMADPTKAIVGGRALVLVLAEDRKHYQAMVSPAERCGIGVFTNESGLIYSGRALGCEK
jgi:hypothetical protein